MRGQFFLIGAVILIVMFYIALPIPQPALPKSELGVMAMNVAQEYVRVATFGLSDSQPIAYLSNWSGWVSSQIPYANFSSLWLLAIGNGSHTNLTVGNWLGQNITITLNISGDVRDLFVQHASINWTSAAVSELFNLTLNWVEEKNFTWPRDKANMWVLVFLERGEDKVRAELEG